MDLYILAIPIFIILIGLNLITLKLALRNKKQKQRQINKIFIIQSHNMKSIFCYLLKNYTLAQLFITRKAENKIPMLFTISITAILSYFFPYFYNLLMVGSFVSLSFLGLQITFIPTQVKQGQVKSQNQPKLSYIYSLIISLSSIILVAISTVFLYKNYRNKFIQGFLVSCLTNLSIDFLLIQPIVLLIVSFPLTKVQRIHKYITIELLRKQQQNLNTVGAEQAVGSPKKRRISPSKVPKIFNFVNDQLFEIQPHQITTSNQQKIFQNTFDIALEMSKKIKKDRPHLPSINTNLTPTSKKIKNIKEQDERSFDGLNNTQNKLKAITPIAQLKQQSRIQEKQQIINRFQDEQCFSNLKIRKKTINNLIPSQTQPIQDNPRLSINVSSISPKSGSQNRKQNQDEYQDANLQDIIILPRRKENQIGSINFQDIYNNNEYQDEYSDQNSQKTYNSNKKRSIEHNKTINGHKNSLLQIREDLNGEIEELDPNSPQKRRRMAKKQQGKEQREENVRKRKRSLRKYSTTKRRIIKFTTGQPYLQYLPHMLTKQIQSNKHKKSQPIVQRQDAIFFDRKRKSVRKLKNTKDPIARDQNNQNDCPQFCIQNL